MYVWLDILTKILVLLVAAVLTVYLISLVAHEANAHKAPSGWEYDWECCNENDCAPVTKIIPGEEYNIYFTKHFKRGVKITYEEMRSRIRHNQSFQVKPSKDANIHLCGYEYEDFYDDNGNRLGGENTTRHHLVCIYLPGTS